MFGKEKIIYTDTLHDFRKTKVGKYNLLDKVIRTYDLDNVHIIIGMYDLPDGNIAYQLLNSNGSFFTEGEKFIKKYYGEFQQEFEALDEAKELQSQVEEKARELEELQQKAETAYRLSRSIQGKNYTELGIQ